LVVSVMESLVFAARQLPAGIPLTPLQIPNLNDQAALIAQIPALPEVILQGDSLGGLSGAAGGFGIEVCNVSTTTSHLIEGGTLKFASVAPFSDGVNSWHICDGFFTRSVPSGRTGGGCGGSEASDEELRVTFPPQAGGGSP
jgi:hypothetical protein